MKVNMEDMVSKVKALKQAQLLQIAQLELILETTPRDSRFSASLLELMKKEETLLRGSTTVNAQAVVQRVDEMLRHETQAFFAKVSAQNARKWQTLRTKLEDERKALRQTSHSAQHAYASSSSKPTFQSCSAADLDKEAERLELDYYNNWLQYEMLHLQEAFKFQSHKIDHEWGTHEATLLADFVEQKERLTGTRDKSKIRQGTQQSTDSPQRRWHHAEKQSTLIQTAPVLSPQVQRRSNASCNNSQNVSELLRIEREYEDALAGLQRQKADAKRWLRRQQIRFAAQSDELTKEKLLVAQILEDILAESSHV